MNVEGLGFLGFTFVSEEFFRE